MMILIIYDGLQLEMVYIKIIIISYNYNYLE